MMGKGLDLVRTEIRLPKRHHQRLVELLAKEKIPINAALTALVDALTRGHITIARAKPRPPYVLARATVRDVEAGRIKATAHATLDHSSISSREAE